MIDNAIIEETVINNNKVYKIHPKEGYKLHEKSRDEAVVDENGIETGEIRLGYTLGVVTAGGYNTCRYCGDRKHIYPVAGRMGCFP